MSQLLANLAKLDTLVLDLIEEGRLGQLLINLAALLNEVGDLAREDETVEGAMQHSVDAEPVDTHRLHHRVSLVALAALERIEHDRLGLLVRHNLTHSAILGIAAVAFLHLLHDAELLALLDASAHPVWPLGQVVKLHVLQHGLVEADRKLLFREVWLGQDCNFEDALVLFDWSGCERLRRWHG